MDIQSFTCGPYQTNAYILSCSDTKECAIIDPAPESFDAIVESIEKNKLKPKSVLLTHSHFDHIGDLAKIKDYYHIPVFVHPNDKENVTHPGSDGIPFFMDTPATQIDILLTDGQIIKVGSLSIEVIHLPGHSPGGVGFYLKSENTLISGDTLFKGSIGNLSLPTANIEDMKVSLKKLSRLPPNTTVYSGHGASTTIGRETWLEAPEELFPDLQ